MYHLSLKKTRHLRQSQYTIVIVLAGMEGLRITTGLYLTVMISFNLPTVLPVMTRYPKETRYFQIEHSPRYIYNNLRNFYNTNVYHYRRIIFILSKLAPIMYILNQILIYLKTILFFLNQILVINFAQI